MKTSKIFLLLFFISLIFPKISLAAMSFTIDEIVNNPKELLVDEEIGVKVSFSGVSGEKQYYLFLAFRKPESGAYNFGFTANNDGDWIKYNDSFTNFYKVEIKESSWSGTLKIKPDYDSNGFKGEGEYQIRAGRYVGRNNETWAEGQDLRIFLKAPLPTPTSTPIPTSTPTLEPTATPTPSPTNTPQPTPQPSSTPTPTPVITTAEEDVLGEEDNLLTLNQDGVVFGGKTETADIKDLYRPPEKQKSLLFPVLTITGGLGFVAFAIWSFLKQEKNSSDVI